MKKLLVLIVILFSCLLPSCSSSSYITTEDPNINISECIDSVNIAVLPFSKQGPFLPAYIGTLFADKFSDELFLAKKYFVVDKSKIKEVFAELKIKNPSNLNYSEIGNIGSQLNAKYVITGSILQYTDTELIGLGSEYKLKVTCRILSTESGDVVGLISTLSKSKNTNVIDVLDAITKKIVRELKNDY